MKLEPGVRDSTATGFVMSSLPAIGSGTYRCSSTWEIGADSFDGVSTRGPTLRTRSATTSGASTFAGGITGGVPALVLGRAATTFAATGSIFVGPDSTFAGAAGTARASSTMIDGVGFGAGRANAVTGVGPTIGAAGGATGNGTALGAIAFTLGARPTAIGETGGTGGTESGGETIGPVSS